MSTKAYYPLNEIGAGKVGFSKTRSIIEAAFYGNNVVKVNTLKEAYNLAKNSPGTIVTDMPVYRGEEFGLDSDARVLLFNDGAITGRYATARRIAGEPGVDCDALDKVVMDAVYTARFKKLYHATVYAGLDPEFMVKCHLLIPEGEENILYNWMLNFQYMSDDYVKMYKASKPVGDGKEADIYIFDSSDYLNFENETNEGYKNEEAPIFLYTENESLFIKNLSNGGFYIDGRKMDEINEYMSSENLKNEIELYKLNDRGDLYTEGLLITDRKSVV